MSAPAGCYLYVREFESEQPGRVPSPNRSTRMPVVVTGGQTGHGRVLVLEPLANSAAAVYATVWNPRPEPTRAAVPECQSAPVSALASMSVVRAELAHGLTNIGGICEGPTPAISHSGQKCRCGRAVRMVVPLVGT